MLIHRKVATEHNYSNCFDSTQFVLFYSKQLALTLFLIAFSFNFNDVTELCFANFVIFRTLCPHAHNQQLSVFQFLCFFQVTFKLTVVFLRLKFSLDLQWLIKRTPMKFDFGDKRGIKFMLQQLCYVNERKRTWLYFVEEIHLFCECQSCSLGQTIYHFANMEFKVYLQF